MGGAQSHVKVSFDLAEYTAEVDGVGTLRLLDAIRTCGLSDSVKFYQASTSELYGKVQEVPQRETTPFYRPTEVEQLLGDPTKAKTKLGWKPKVDFSALVKDMMDSDIALMRKNELA